MLPRLLTTVIAPTSLTNGPPFIEIQGEYILKVLEAQRKQDIQTIDAKAEAAAAWREHCLALVEKTLLVKTNSWYMGAKYVALPNTVAIQ